MPLTPLPWGEVGERSETGEGIDCAVNQSGLLEEFLLALRGTRDAKRTPSPLTPLPQGEGNKRLALPQGEGNKRLALPQGEGNKRLALPQGEGNKRLALPRGEGNKRLALPRGEGNKRLTLPQGEGMAPIKRHAFDTSPMGRGRRAQRDG
ncbi:hypothetical protein [Planctomycetes bacterium Pan216]|uniref:hypothetical protein n=1 Tax=Kolteria novifilia TaxID=2527975 RepID=UPI00119FEF5E